MTIHRISPVGVGGRLKTLEFQGEIEICRGKKVLSTINLSFKGYHGHFRVYHFEFLYKKVLKDHRSFWKILEKWDVEE